MERSRRQRLASWKLRVAVLIGDQEVTTTDAVPLAFPSFSVAVHTRCTVSLLTAPDSVRCRLYAAGTFTDQLLAELFLPVPDPLQPPSIDRYAFSGAQIDGSLRHLKAERDVPVGRRVSGDVEAMVAWVHQSEVDPQQDGSIARSVQVVAEALAQSQDLKGKQPQHLTLQHRSNVASVLNRGGAVDPNDPRNADLMELLRRAQLAEARGCDARLLCCSVLDAHCDVIAGACFGHPLFGMNCSCCILRTVGPHGR